MIDPVDHLEALRNGVKKAVEASLTEETLKKLNKQAEAIAEEITSAVRFSIEDTVGYELGTEALNRAEAVIEAILNGNQAALERAIGESNPYTRANPYLQSDERIMEYGAVELRRRIVDEHPDLLKSSRIKDLEAQKKRLEQRNAELAAENRKLREAR